MKYITLILSVAVLTLITGCAGMDRSYETYSNNQAAIATAKYAAIQEIAKSNPNAAAFALMGGGANTADSMRAPESIGDSVFKYLGVLAGPVAQMYTAHQNTIMGVTQSDNATKLGIAQSENSTALGVSTNATFSGISNGGFNALTSVASRIQAPAPNIITTTNTTLSGTGVLGSGVYSTQANPTTSTTNNTTATNTTNANRNCTGAGSGNISGTTTPTTGAGGSANC